MASEIKPEIDNLVRSLNADPDKAHSDYTPAVHKLIEIGEPALNAVLDLLLVEDEVTRLRAQRVIEGVTMQTYGFRFGLGWSNEQGSAEWQRLWEAMGNLDYKAPTESRIQSVQLWKQWLKKRADK